jgi:hypothetical protein
MSAEMAQSTLDDRPDQEKARQAQAKQAGQQVQQSQLRYAHGLDLRPCIPILKPEAAGGSRRWPFWSLHAFQARTHTGGQSTLSF